jgi:hypothetical protein
MMIFFELYVSYLFPLAEEVQQPRTTRARTRAGAKRRVEDVKEVESISDTVRQTLLCLRQQLILQQTL